MTKKESTVYLGGVPIPVRIGENLEDARARYNKRAMAAYRKEDREELLERSRMMAVQIQSEGGKLIAQVADFRRFPPEGLKRFTAYIAWPSHFKKGEKHEAEEEVDVDAINRRYAKEAVVKELEESYEADWKILGMREQLGLYW